MTPEYIDPVFSRLFSPGFIHDLGLPRLPGLASQCAVCRSWPAQPVCPACVNCFMPRLLRCARCALALPAYQSGNLPTDEPLCTACALQPPPLDGALAAVPYAYPWSHLISRYKFSEQHGWAGFFASLLLKTPGVRQTLEELEPQDWIIPMPLSAERLRTRGFNQAWELASALARQSGTPAQAHARLLLRVKHTLAQSQLRREDRLANVKGAFQVDPLRTAGLRGRSVVLVDDVMTSGASMFEAAQVLREAGAATITAMVLARTAPA